jgi:DNA repair exonuclease SbcCD ATPase subunit
MATLDEGVVNLQRFVGLLASAVSATQQVGDHASDAVRRLSDLEGEAEQEGGGLNDELTELGQALESEVAETVSALTELMQAADDAQDKAQDAQDKMEQTATDLDEKAGAVETALEQSDEQLTSEGFQPLAHALDEAQQEMETESSEEEQAFTELESAVGGFQSEADTAWSEAEAELDEAAGDMNEGETELHAESNEGVHGFETAAGALEAACTELADDVHDIYDVLSQGVEAQGQAWQQAVQAAGHEALTFTTEARQDHLEQPAAMVRDEALATLTQEYETLDAVLEAAASAVSTLEPLAEDLVKCKSVLGDIDALTAALAS